MNNRAVLLVNLGSPAAPDAASLRAYLDEFLMDPCVIQLPWLLRAILVKLLILPTRPAKSAEAYRSIWTERGSPLLALSEDMREKLQPLLDVPVHLAMRYGKPDISSELQKIAATPGIDEVLFIPLYPHYADSTVTTSIRAAEQAIKKQRLPLKLLTLPPFYDEPAYIRALLDSARPWLDRMGPKDHLLFSYHGLPELHITKADPTGQHCLQQENCCVVPSPAHATCYRHQVLRTTEAFVAAAQLQTGQYSLAFQSRLGRAKWLEPSTESSLQTLAARGVENVYVICPAFVTDCLETLEEIAIQGAESFIEAGGKSLQLIPCLNDHPQWLACMADWIRAFESADAA